MVMASLKPKGITILLHKDLHGFPGALHGVMKELWRVETEKRPNFGTRSSKRKWIGYSVFGRASRDALKVR